MRNHSGATEGDDDNFMPTLATSGMADGPKVDKLTMARRRMAAKNSSIAISLADHAERVAIKKARGIADDGTQTAAERLAALRRRISERRGGGTVPGDGKHESAATCKSGDVLKSSDAPASNEDGKMHYIGDSISNAAASSSGEGVEANGIGLAGSAACGGGGCNGATASAAATWAQHAVLRSGADDDNRHLSAA